MYCDMQIFLLCPLYVIMYKRWPRACYVLMVIVYIETLLFCAYISFLYDIKSGPLSIEGYYMFAYLINKPWCKLGS
jgi:hypothetical protein